MAQTGRRFNQSKKSKNVVINQGWPGKGRYFRKRQKNERKRLKKSKAKLLKLCVDYTLAFILLALIVCLSKIYYG